MVKDDLSGTRTGLVKGRRGRERKGKVEEQEDSESNRNKRICRIKYNWKGRERGGKELGQEACRNKERKVERVRKRKVLERGVGYRSGGGWGA